MTTCEGMTWGRSFQRCTRSARYVVGQEWSGETISISTGRIIRSARLVEFWGACYQHRESFRAYGENGLSEIEAWSRVDGERPGVYNGHRLGWVEMPADASLD